MKFGEILKNLRIEKGLTQKELANACNVTATCICQLENGSRNPTGSTVAVLARFFDVSSDYLLGLSDEGIHFGGKVAKTPAGGNTAEERELWEDYHELSKEGKELVKATIKTLLGSARSGKAKKA